MADASYNTSQNTTPDPVTAINHLEQWFQQHKMQPLIQAPMAGVATPELAAAVSNAGALGSIGIGASSVDQARDMIRATRALANNPFNVNVFCHARAQRDADREANWVASLTSFFDEFEAPAPTQLNEIYTSFIHSPEAQAMLLEEAPAVVSFHFGLPDKALITAFKAAGTLTLATATNLHEAEQARQAGIDAIVAQGYEAGGHRGMFDPCASDQQLPTAVLVRMLATEQPLPVIAAGGIMDGAGMNAMKTLGATAVQLGTAFVLCPESAANAGYRARLKSAAEHTTEMTLAISGRPARGLSNRLTHHGAEAAIAVADYPLAYDIAKQLHAAASAKGSHEFAAHWAGQGAPLSREMTAAGMVKVLLEEANW